MKPRTPNQKKRYTALNKRLSKYVSMVNALYNLIADDAARMALQSGYEGEEEFRFKDYPSLKSKVNNMMRFFSHDLSFIIHSGTSDEWKQSNLIQDLLASDVLKAYGVKHGREKFKKYYQPNNEALKAFQRRKDKGFTISQKIWNQAFNMRREMELCISSAIEKGTSAVTLSKRISKYLHDYPSLQKDYKERYGKAVDCKDCEYRSIRLARSEINMAYREAEQLRWQQMDFIKGYEIKLSGSHPKHDICDELAGIYPLWFKWTGWHPNDLCFTIPIVMTDDEWYGGKGQRINFLPPNFLNWIGENQDRIAKAESKGTLPYWIADNKDYFYQTEEGNNNDSYNDIANKVSKMFAPQKSSAYTFVEPFSPIVKSALDSMRNKKTKIRYFNEIADDNRAVLLNRVGDVKTVMFPSHKGKHSRSWNETKRMAYDLNAHNETVIFLPEMNNVTNSDALVLFREIPTLADFKYSTTTKSNTLFSDLRDGFMQAGTIVLKLENMDAGQFRETIEYMKRNNINMGNIKLLNKYGDIKELTEKQLLNNDYRKKIKGFL